MFRPEEIYAISQEISRKYAPVVAVKSSGLAKGIALSQKELLGISEEIRLRYAPKLNSAKPKLVLLPIDPENLYVSWHLGVPQPNPGTQEDPNNQALVLRIYPNQTERSSVNTPSEWFDIAIDAGKHQEKVCLPKGTQASVFTAEIGTLEKNDQFHVLAASNAADLPQLFEYSHLKDNSRLPLNQNQAYSANQENLPDSRSSASNRDIK